MSAGGDTRRWRPAVGRIKLHAMGRHTALAGLPHYRQVLVATAVRALRGGFPVLPGFESRAERRSWLAAAVDAVDWRAAAVAAGAVADHAVPPR